MSVRDFCESKGITEGQFFGRETIGGSLGLDSLESLPEGFAPVVGGNLWLSSLTSLPEGFTPTVGGSLWLGSLTSLPEGFTPTVGGSLWLGEWLRCPVLRSPNYPLHWCNGRYINADDRFSEVISHRKNVWKLKDIGKQDIYYLVTDGSSFAHGESVREAYESLAYKLDKRDLSEYRGLAKDHRFSFAEAVQFYRSITGSCAEGCRRFVTENKIEKRDYTIAEILERTAGQYGSKQLAEFLRSN